MDENKSKVYALIDNQHRVTRIEGGYTMQNIENIDDWTFIDEGIGDKYNLCQTHYLEKSIREERGLYRYKYENNEIIERTQAEIDGDVEQGE